MSDVDVENKLRPTSMTEYVGQKKVVDSLDIYIKAAKSRKEALDHVLLYGPPGLGKTTLSHIIANELGSQLKITSGPAIEHAADLAAILTNLQKNDVFCKLFMQFRRTPFPRSRKGREKYSPLSQPFAY